MKSNNALIFITIISALAGLLFGYDTGVINGTQFYFSQYFNLSEVMKGWVVGSALIGCLVGAIGSGVISAKIGRKNSLIFSAILFTIGAWGSGLPQFMPQDVTFLVIFRILGGIGIGLASMNAPIYISEISPSKVRGKMVSCYQLAVVTGFFIVFLITYFIGHKYTNQQDIDYGWRVMFWSEMVPSILFFVGLLFVPKSPRWLFLQGRNDDAIVVLKKIHGEEKAAQELAEIEKHIEKEKLEKKTRISLLTKGIFGIVIIGAIFSALQQFTGINAVLYYGSTIFEKALGFNKSDVLSQQILLAGVNFSFTFIAMFTIDKLGRKPLIYIGCIGMAIGFLMLAITLMTKDVGIVSLLGILIFIGSFAMSMGPVLWVMLAEMFPNKIRSGAMAVAVAAQWGANYLVSQTFPMLMGSTANNEAPWNGSMPYFIFIVFIIFIIFFTWKWLPETKGKSLEEVQKIWGVSDKLG